MRPKTATEFEIVGLSAKLPTVTPGQLQPAFNKCFENYGVQSRKTMFCLECGHSWKLESTQPVKKVLCQECNKTLSVTERYRNGLDETAYSQIITVAGNFQIVRMLCMTKIHEEKQNQFFFRP